MDNRFFTKHLRNKDLDSCFPNKTPTNILEYLCTADTKESRILILNRVVTLFCHRFNIKRSEFRKPTTDTHLFKAAILKYKKAMYIELLSRYGVYCKLDNPTLDDIIVTGVSPKINPRLVRLVTDNTY